MNDRLINYITVVLSVVVVILGILNVLNVYINYSLIFLLLAVIQFLNSYKEFKRKKYGVGAVYLLIGLLLMFMGVPMMFPHEVIRNVQ